MSDKEMLVALKTCLHGSRKKIYENVTKAKKLIAGTDEGPGEIYRAVKKRLFRFLETSTEKQLRVRGAWTNLEKTRGMTALQFEAEWEQVHADLEEVGLEINPLEKFLGYIVKVGTPVSETIRMDRRPRPDGSGGTTTRLPQTWEECHEVLCEIEGVKAGSKAFTAARAAGQRREPDPGADKTWSGAGQDGGKRGKGGGKGKEKGKGDGPKSVCYEFRDTGKCKFGDDCRYSHDPKDTGRTRQGALTKAAKKKAAAAAKAAADAASEAAAAAAKAAAGKPGKAGGKGGGKGGKEGKGGDPNSKKKILCKFIKDPSKGTCNRGKDCPFSHNKRLFDDNFKFVGRPRRKGDKGGG